MVGVALVSMTALSVFHNAQIINRREGAQRLDVVETGDPFDAPWLVAKDLVTAKLARADDYDDLDDEPAEAVEPHPTISNPELKRHNARRQAQRRPGLDRPDLLGERAREPLSVTGADGSSGTAVTADALHPAGPAPTLSTADGQPKPPEAIVTPPATPSTPKSNVPPIPPTSGSAGAAG